MARKKFTSPKLDIQITPENYERAVKSSSGGCLIADAIKEQYPHLSSVSADMATIRASDREAGVRYTWLTPAPGQHLLLWFDQGWARTIDRVVLRRAVQITRLIRAKSGPDSPAAIEARRHERIAEFDARIAQGEELTSNEKRSLTQLRNRPAAPARPATRGPAQVRATNTEREVPVVEGGAPRLQGPAHPNLLRGRNRHFGAKLADPGLAFQEAVEAAVAERLAAESAAQEAR